MDLLGSKNVHGSPRQLHAKPCVNSNADVPPRSGAATVALLQKLDGPKYRRVKNDNKRRMFTLAKGAASRCGLSRTHIAAARMMFERHALATFMPPRPREGGRILCYHSVDDAEMGVNDVGAKQFRRHIELALERGYRFVKASEIAVSGGTPKELAITFDDGRKSVMEQAARILTEYQIPWTFFIVTTWTDLAQEGSAPQFACWTDIERLMRAGVEIGSHTRTHPDFGKIPTAQMFDELSGSRYEMNKRLGVAPVSFAIPLGQSMNWSPYAGAIAREAGYDLIYAQAEDTRPLDTIPRTFVTRFDNLRIFSALLSGAYDCWEEWV